jgi:uncharacterized protein
VKCRLLSLGMLLCLTSCIDLEGTWYTPVPLEEYVWPESVVPATHIELVELPGTQVEGEDEAPTLFGVWAHQCTSAAPSSCAEHTEHDEYVEARRERTILYFHGNGSNLEVYWDRITILWRMGFRVFAIDYRGFGRSTGTPSEAGVYADGATALAHVKARLASENALIDPANPPPAATLRLAYYGWSLGSTVAIDLATIDSPAAMVTEAALASAQAFSNDALGIGISHTVLMDTEFDNLGKIPSILAPKLITHGTDDDFVKFEFSEALFDAASEPKRFLPVLGAVHGNVPCPTRDPSTDSRVVPCVASPAYLEAVTSFYDEYLF